MVSDLDRHGHQDIRGCFHDHLSAHPGLDLGAELPAGQFLGADGIIDLLCKHFYIAELQGIELAQDQIPVSPIGKRNSARGGIKLYVRNVLQAAQRVLKYLRLRGAETPPVKPQAHIG